MKRALSALVVLTTVAASAVGQEPLRLRYAIGIGDGAKESDGVTFRVEVRTPQGDVTKLAEDTWSETAWHECTVDLSAYDGQDVFLRFITDPGPTTTFDWAMWGEPAILRGDEVLVDLNTAKLWHTGILGVDGRERPMDSNATGALFQLSTRGCGGVNRKGYFAHPPWKQQTEDQPLGAAFGEFRVTVGAELADAVRDPMPVIETPETSPFPMGLAPCFRLTSPITVDGSIDDWPEELRRACLTVGDRRQMALERVSHKPGWKAGWTGQHDFSSIFFLGWDADNLYVAEIRRDDKLLFADIMTGDFSGSDSLRICISRSQAGEELGQGDFVFAINPEGERDKPTVQLCDYGADLHHDVSLANVRIAPRVYSRGWVMEAAIPFALLGVTPEPRQTLGFQLILTDSDTPMDRHYEMVWNPVDGGEYRKRPDTFGTLVLCQRDFPWLQLDRKVFAQGEEPRLACGLFSLRDADSANAEVSLRTPQGAISRFVPGLSFRHGDTLRCPPLTTAGSFDLECVAQCGIDGSTQSVPIDVVADRVEPDLTPFVQAGEATLLPSTGSRGFRNSVTRDNDGAYAFRYEAADDDAVEYRLRPGVGFDVEMLVNGAPLWRSDPGRAGLVAAPPVDAAECDVRKVDQAGDTVTITVACPDDVTVTYTVSMIGKSLVIDVQSNKGVFEHVRGPLYGLEAEAPFIPYLDRRMCAFRKDGLFLSSWCDWTITAASSVQPLGSSRYLPTTDGTRNPVRDRIVLTVSSKLHEVLPNMPNAKSPFHDVLASKVILDIWNWGSRFSATARYLDALKGYGVDEIGIIYHVWQRHGYDNGLPEHIPANPKQGGEEDMKILGATAKRCGYLLSLHENYIDYYPNFPDYTEDAIALNSAGRKIEAWFMPSTGIQSFRLKPSWIEHYVRTQAPEIHRRYETTAAYLDVHSVALPFQVDFDADAPGAASMLYSLERLTWLFDYMRETHRGPLFGEGNMHAVWAGRIDGCEAQVGSRGGEMQPVLVDFDLLKIHPLAVNHGMGYYSRWHRTRSGRLTDTEMDKYRAQELAYGHAGFLNTGELGNLTQCLREYFLVQPIQTRYAASTPERIEYLFDTDDNGNGRWVSGQLACRTDAPRKVHVRYANGLDLWVNDERGGWQVEGHVLPPYGFVARGAGVDAATAVRNDGLVGDYVATDKNLFVDPRTYDALYSDSQSVTRITPLAAAIVPAGKRSFQVTYRWDVRGVPDRDYVTFVHYTDGNGRILWQDDHNPATPVTKWQTGTIYEQGPRTVEVPPEIGPGLYDIRVGMFLPKVGRLALDDQDAGNSTYLVGRVRVTGDAESALVFLPKPDVGAGYLSGRNPAGSMVDFGKLRTDMALRIVIGKRDLYLRPIPHGRQGNVTLDLRALVPTLLKGDVHVTATGEDGNPLGKIAAQRRDSLLELDLAHPDAWQYRVGLE